MLKYIVLNLSVLNPIIALAAVAFIFGCAGSSSPSATSEASNEPGLFASHAIEIDGTSRSFDFFIPTNLGPSEPPLVFLFHGAKLNTDHLTGERGRVAPYSVWMELAKAEKFIVVYPQGAVGPLDGPGWNDCRADASTNPAEDDVAFVAALIDQFVRTHNVDPQRVYASGTSNGGHMSLRLAHELSDKIAAVAPMVAAMPAISCNVPVNPISVLFMNGTVDPLLPYGGGKVAPEAGGRGTVLSAQESVAAWVTFNQTDEIPTVRAFADIDPSDGSTVTSTTYMNGIEETEIVLYEIAGGGHVEPSLQEQYSRIFEVTFGRQNHDIEMATEIWNFFRSKTLN